LFYYLQYVYKACDCGLEDALQIQMSLPLYASIFPTNTNNGAKVEKISSCFLYPLAEVLLAVELWFVLDYYFSKVHFIHTWIPPNTIFSTLSFSVSLL